MAGTVKRIAGPAYIASSATDIYTPPNAAAYVVIKHIHVDNKDASPRTFTLYIGATGGSAAGTELFKDVSVAAGSYFDWYSPGLKLISTDFLSGIASSANTLVITVIGEYQAT